MDKPDKPQDSESGELPPVSSTPAPRVPTPVLLKQLRSVLDRLKSAGTPPAEAPPVTIATPKK